MLMEGDCFQVINFGIDVSSNEFVEAVESHKPTSFDFPPLSQ